MQNRTWLAGAGVAAALLAVVVTSSAIASVTGSRGPLSAATATGSETGRYRLMEISRNRRTVDRIEAEARHLNVSGASRGNRPSFHVFLIQSSGRGATDFGAMRVNRFGQAAFVFDSRRASLPSGVSALTDFSGGTIEVRDSSGSAVLSATLSSF